MEQHLPQAKLCFAKEQEMSRNLIIKQQLTEHEHERSTLSVWMVSGQLGSSRRDIRTPLVWLAWTNMAVASRTTSASEQSSITTLIFPLSIFARSRISSALFFMRKQA
jgi:hypothetical protein